MRLFPTEEFVAGIRGCMKWCGCNDIPGQIIWLATVNALLILGVSMAIGIHIGGIFSLFCAFGGAIFMVIFFAWGLFLSDEARKELSGGS